MTRQRLILFGFLSQSPGDEGGWPRCAVGCMSGGLGDAPSGPGDLARFRSSSTPACCRAPYFGSRNNAPGPWVGSPSKNTSRGSPSVSAVSCSSSCRTPLADPGPGIRSEPGDQEEDVCLLDGGTARLGGLVVTGGEVGQVGHRVAGPGEGRFRRGHERPAFQEAPQLRSVRQEDPPGMTHSMHESCSAQGITRTCADAATRTDVPPRHGRVGSDL